jgi:pSer/pThr/pTyr-binding forkhead associated (FHA) protein
MSADSLPHAPTLTLSGGTRLTKPLMRDQPFAIGASRTSDFRIPHPSIAPTHVVITWNGNETTAQDASGGTGFLVNGHAQATAALHNGDVLRVGDFEFLFESTKAAKPAQADNSLLVHFRGRAVPEVPLVEGLTFGSGADADVRLDDLSLLPVHATLEREASGFVIVDKGGSGLLANGRFFDRHSLLIGDRLDFGDQHAFTFDGFALRRIPREAGCALTAQHVVLRSRRRTILGDAGFSARAGEFVGIIGPSGAGKSSLLRTLAGLRNPTSGTVSLNHADVKTLPESNSYFGYVPQEEIVHLELTGRQALRYAAALRLPMRTPTQEIEKLIENLAARLGLTEHLDTLARELSG